MKRIFLAFTAAAALAVGLIPPVHGAPSCPLNEANSSIKHVVFLQFDNTHLNRDNPNVPSDLEQMPTLYNFMKDKGTLGSNHHTVLICHTAAGIISTLTGVYPDRTGTGVTNSFNYKMADFTARHDALAAEIKESLELAAFEDTPIHPGTAGSLAGQAHRLIAEMKGMANAAH